MTEHADRQIREALQQSFPPVNTELRREPVARGVAQARCSAAFSVATTLGFALAEFPAA